MRFMTASKGALGKQHIAGLAVLGAITLIGFASPFLPTEFVASLGPWLAAAKASPWAPLAAMLGFAVFASVGVPQIVLITALVAVFGPWWGLLYSWTGKLTACSLGFAIGRRFGARIVAANAGPRLGAFMRQLAKRGFLVSALIRMVPTIPSVLINIAAGATPIRFGDFFFGTALGSVPKMALMAFGGHAAMEAVRTHNAWAWALLAAVVVLWAVLAVAARRWMRDSRESESL